MTYVILIVHLYLDIDCHKESQERHPLNNLRRNSHLVLCTRRRPCLFVNLICHKSDNIIGKY